MPVALCRAGVGWGVQGGGVGRRGDEVRDEGWESEKQHDSRHVTDTRNVNLRVQKQNSLDYIKQAAQRGQPTCAVSYALQFVSPLLLYVG